MANIWRYPFYPLWPVNAFFDRSLNVLSVSYTVHIRFVRYISVTRTAMSVSSPLFVRYLSGTYALLMRFMRSLHHPRRPSSPPRRRSPPDKHFLHFFLSVRRPLALSGDMWQHLKKKYNRGYSREMLLMWLNLPLPCPWASTLLPERTGNTQWGDSNTYPWSMFWEKKKFFHLKIKALKNCRISHGIFRNKRLHTVCYIYL